MIRTPDENLKQYATENQWKVYVAVCETGSNQKAADKLGKGKSTIQSALDYIRRNAAKAGYTPMPAVEAPLVIKGQSTLYKDGEEVARWDKTTRQGLDPEEVTRLPDPKTITKISTMTGPDGRVLAQWIAEKPELVARELLWDAFARELARDVPRLEPTPTPTGLSAMDLLACYPVGDHHTGMLAWAAETGGESYDLKISEALLKGAMDRLIDSCPPCEQSLLAFLGDFTHYDSYDSVTPSGRNLLDAEGRYPKMVDTAVRMIRYAIEAALRRHQRVHVIFEKGNHDPATAAVLTILLAALYENEPRVSVDTSPQFFHYYQFGKVLIGTNHGDKVKADKLLGIMAADQAEAWGQTEHRTMLTGHVHHESRKEYPGGTVESLGVLAPADAYSARGGWRSVQQMKAIVFHREHGEIERHTVSPAMLSVK